MTSFVYIAIGINFLIFSVLCTDLSQYQEYQELHQEIKKPPVPIIKQTFDQHKQGYQYSYETGNGIQAQETGFIKNKGDKKNEILVQQGTITYHDEHGHPITLTYIADEHGFQPQGAHLPTPPPVPEEIQKSLHQISAPVEQQEYQDFQHIQALQHQYGHLDLNNQQEHQDY